MCLEGFIGIRGECKDAKMYIDDLPGIDISKVSDAAEATDRPLEVVEKCFNLAVDQVFNDWTSFLKEKYDYSSILSDYDYKNAGNHNFIGLTDTNVIITVKKYRQKFVKIDVSGFGIVSDREATLDVHLHDEYGTLIKIVETAIVVGYNFIDIDLSINTDFVISFNLQDLKIGVKEDAFFDYYHKFQGCKPCHHDGISCLEVDINSTDYGFNLMLKCAADRCQLIEYFINELKVPLLYKTGINYLIYALASNRTNAYTRNAKDKIENLLMNWQGGTDTVTGVKTNSAYWQALKSASSATISSLDNIKNHVFSKNYSEIVNSLP